MTQLKISSWIYWLYHLCARRNSIALPFAHVRNWLARFNGSHKIEESQYHKFTYPYVRKLFLWGAKQAVILVTVIYSTCQENRCSYLRSCGRFIACNENFIFRKDKALLPTQRQISARHIWCRIRHGICELSEKKEEMKKRRINLMNVSRNVLTDRNDFSHWDREMHWWLTSQQGLRLFLQRRFKLCISAA